MTIKKLLIACALLTMGSHINAKNEPIDLFNGKDLRNWNLFVDKGDLTADQVFTVKDGVIHCVGKPFGYMYTKETFQNFQLHVEWRWPEEPANSGIFLFVQDGEKLWPHAIECQLHAGDAGDFVLLGGSDLKEFKLAEGEQRPAFPVVTKKKVSNEKPTGQWNSADITCKNGKITVIINGTHQNTGSKPVYKKGHIALQSEGGPVEFRNVQLTPLKGSSK